MSSQQSRSNVTDRSEDTFRALRQIPYEDLYNLMHEKQVGIVVDLYPPNVSFFDYDLAEEICKQHGWLVEEFLAKVAEYVFTDLRHYD